jgi:hypothetical protein
MTQWLGRGPSWEAIVTKIYKSAHPKLAAYEIDNDLAIVGRYPSPDSVESDDVELGKIRPAGEFGERLVKQFGT